MGEMNIRLKDERLIERLSDMAKAHNRSVESEVVEILETAIGQREALNRVLEARRIAAMTPMGRTQTNSTDLVRDDRNR